MTMDANDLLKRMADAYAGLATYADRGVVTATLNMADGTEVTRSPFATAFRRPDRFRYEFVDESSGRGMRIWYEAAETLLWIGRDDLLVRRILSIQKFGPELLAQLFTQAAEAVPSLAGKIPMPASFHAETVTTYSPTRSPEEAAEIEATIRGVPQT